MKKLLLAAAALMILQFTNAQTKEGKFTYEQKIDMYRRIPADNTQMRAMIPQFRTAKFELQFADNQSLYKAAEEEPDMTETTGNGIVMRFNNGGDNEYYRNFTTKKMVESRELMEETYLIDDSLHSITWKLEEGETKVILGYTCKKATGKTQRGSDVVAWYCEDIPVASGPEQFNNLPGMILCVDANKGEIVYTAITFDKKVQAKNIKAPTKGKKVTNEEFAKIQKDLFGNQNGPVRVVTN
jgi:GLPGLI family protein